MVANRYNSTCLVKTYEYTPTAADTYEELPPLKITLPSGKMLRITASAIFQVAYAKGIMLIRGNTVGDTYTLAKQESDVGLNTLAVSTAYTAGSAQDIHVYVKANSKAAIKVVVVYDII